jgi:hypothetical protein
MSKRKNTLLTMGATALLAIIFGTIFPFLGCTDVLTYEVRITEEEINQELQNALPYSANYSDIVSFTVDNVTVELTEGSDRAAATMVGRVDVLETVNVFQATVDLTAGVRYEPSTGEFFLTEPEVVSVDVEGIPPALNEPVTLVADLVVGGILESYPIFTLEAEDFTTNLARLVLTEVKIEDGSLVAKLSI